MAQSKDHAPGNDELRVRFDFNLHTWSSPEGRRRGLSEEDGSKEEVEEVEKKELGESNKEEWEGGRGRELEPVGKDG